MSEESTPIEKTLEDIVLNENAARESEKRMIKSSRLNLRIDQLDEIDINPDLTSEQKEKVNTLLWEYQDCFANSLEELGFTHVVEHEINLKPGTKPFYCPGIK